MPEYINAFMITLKKCSDVEQSRGFFYRIQRQGKISFVVSMIRRNQRNYLTKKTFKSTGDPSLSKHQRACHAPQMTKLGIK